MSLHGELEIYNENEMKEKREIREGGVRRVGVPGGVGDGGVKRGWRIYDV